MMEGSAVPGPSQGYTAANDGYSDEAFIGLVAEMWDLKIRPQELHEMKPEVVQKIYYAFLKEIGVNIERFDEIPAQMLDSIQSREDYRIPMQLTALSSRMRKYFKLIFSDESFRAMDVFNPKPKRSRRFFGMIYYFMMCLDNYVDELSEKEVQVQNLIERQNKTKVRLEKIKQHTGERKADNTRSEVSKEEEIKRLDEKTRDLQACQERKNNLKDKIDALNLSLAGLNTTKKNTELMIMESKNEVQRLESQVIHDGEKEEIKKRDEKVFLLKKDNLKRKEHLNQQQQNLKNKVSQREKVEKFVSVFQEIELLKSKAKDLQTSLEQKESEVSLFYENIRNQEEQSMQLTQQQASAAVNYKSMMHTRDLQLKSLEDERKKQKKILEDTYRNNTEQDIVYKDMLDTFADLEGQINQCKERINTMNGTTNENYKMILDVMETEKQKLAEILLEGAESLKEFMELAE